MKRGKHYLVSFEKAAKAAAQKLFPKFSVLNAEAEETNELDGSPSVNVLVVLDRAGQIDARSWIDLDIKLQNWLREKGIERSVYSRVLTSDAIKELQEH